MLVKIIKEYDLDPYFTIQERSIRNIFGSEFLFAGLNEETISGLKSMNSPDFVWIEEASSITANTWTKLDPTIRAEGSEIWCTLNREMDRDPISRLFIVGEPPPDSIVIEMEYWDNPYFPQVLKNQMLQCKATDYESYLHIWEGQPISHSQASVFKGKFVSKAFTPDEDLWSPLFGMDFGFAIDPTVLLKCWVCDDRLYVEHELYEVGLETEHMPDAMKEIPGSQTHIIYADSARPETISHLRRHGFPRCVAVPKWSGSILDGVERLRAFNRIVVHPRCTHTLEELASYSYKVDRNTNLVLPQIVEKDDHCLIGSTLVMTDKGEIPIEDIRIGDKVLTRRGFKAVQWAGCTGMNRRVIPIQAGSHLLYATPDHKILTQKGMIPSNALRYAEDQVLTIEGGSKCPSSKQLNTTGSYTIGTQSPQIELIESTSLWRDSVDQDFTSKSGLIIMETSPKDFTSIMLMETPSITTSAILSASPDMIMPVNMPLSIMKSMFKKFRLIWRKFVPSPSLGTLLQKVKNFMLDWHKTLQWKIGHSLTLPVSAVVNSSRQLQIGVVSAPIPVSLNGEDSPVLIMSNEFALSAEARLALTDLALRCAVQSIAEPNSDGFIADKVYDLTVEDQHEFFANGVLVSNCIDSLRYAITPLIKGHKLKPMPDRDAEPQLNELGQLVRRPQSEAYARQQFAALGTNWMQNL